MVWNAQYALGAPKPAPRSGKHASQCSCCSPTTELCDQGRKLAPVCQGAVSAAAITPGIGTSVLGPVYGKPIPCARQCCSKMVTRSSRAFMWLLVDQRAKYQ